MDGCAIILKSLLLSGFEHPKGRNPALQPERNRAARPAPNRPEIKGFYAFGIVIPEARAKRGLSGIHKRLRIWIPGLASLARDDKSGLRPAK
jgi:hypothetical protein